VNTLRNIFRTFSRKEKFVFVAAAALCVVSGIVLLSIFIQRTTTVVPAAGGQYAEGIVGQPTYVNPVLAATEVDRSLVRLLFANLAELTDKIEPDQNGRIWKVHLRQDTLWSDKRKLTADDVVFTIQKIQDPETQSPLSAAWQGVAVSRQSELEIQFNLVSPYPFFDENLKQLYVLPKHIFADVPGANWKLSQYNLEPVASGPYQFLSSDKEPNGFIKAYRVTANPAYIGDKPYVHRIDFNFFTRSEDMVRSFNMGVIDGFGTFDPEVIRGTDRAHEEHSFSLPSYYALFFNQNQNTALQDPVVRRVLSESVNRDTLVQKIFDGRARPLTGPLSLEQATSGISLDDARALLDGAGWKTQENGPRVKSQRTGTSTLSFTITVPQIGFLTKTAQELKAYWSELGANVEIRELSAEEVIQKSVKNRDYQALLFGNILHPGFDLYSFWHSNERFYPGLNLAIYQNRKADQLIESIRRELNEEKNQTDLRELERVIIADHPAVFLYSPNYVMIAARDLKGVTGETVSESSDRFDRAEEWYLRTARTIR
jgi:peptide/nickel transport system substrate-binding protein